jgi:tetraacyldisaccharide 4'-kinase
MKYLRWLLLPLSLLYGLVVIIRNWLYDAGVLKSYKFNKPVISVGNLDVGGAGKSPMTEYLIRLLKSDYKIATLSRGYGRKTKGYLEGVRSTIQAPGVNSHNDLSLTLAGRIGDEPAQFASKFPDITVAVCEKRVRGIKKLISHHDLIILDDAYQHRQVEPGLSILLFDHGRINEPHFMLPAGNLREPFSGRWRAQILVISKCPRTLSIEERELLAAKVQPLPYQNLFFTAIGYGTAVSLNRNFSDLVITAETSVFLLTGIANADPLVNYITGFTSQLVHHKYPDHHQFTPKNISKLAAEFLACKAQKKIIVTTEKDAQRLEKSQLVNSKDLPVFVLPISVEFLENSEAEFNRLIINYVRKHRENNGLY